MMLPPVAGSPSFSDAQIIALLPNGVATADTQMAILLAGIWKIRAYRDFCMMVVILANSQPWYRNR
jgi:hypothetical protein